MTGVPVTVLMPVFNAGAYLRAAVDSILGQTHRDFELLVVDDGSTDASPQILDSAIATRGSASSVSIAIGAVRGAQSRPRARRRAPRGEAGCG